MYVSLQAHKVLFIVAVSIILLSCVAATFMYKSTRYGDIHLGTVISRVFQKQVTYVRYAAEFPGSALAATPFSFFSEAEYTADRSEARGVPVLVYHALTEESIGAVTPDVFAEHLNALHEAGWKTITLEQLNGFLRGEESVPERSFMITFDDGAKDSYYPVDPILRVFNYTAVTFLLPKYTIGGGTHYYLSSGEVRSMLGSRRWEIGSHGQDSHEFLPVDTKGTTGAALANLLWLPDRERLETEAEFRDRVSKDLQTAREDLEAEFGVPVETFAFPFGEFGQLTENYPEAPTVLENIANSFYDLGFYQTRRGEGFSQNYPETDTDDIIMVRRIEPTGNVSGEELVSMLERGIPKDLPYHDQFTVNNGWTATWGEYSVDSNTLRMEARETESGAAVVLDGTRDWQNYKITAELEIPSQTGFVIWSRFKDSNNTAACNFGNGFMHAEDTVNGNHRVANGIRDPAIAIPQGTFSVEVEVVDRTLTCTLADGTSVTTEFLNRDLDSGGIGIKIWDPELGRAGIIVHELTVEPL